MKHIIKYICITIFISYFIAACTFRDAEGDDMTLGDAIENGLIFFAIVGVLWLIAEIFGGDK